jgi:hypothetical protein
MLDPGSDQVSQGLEQIKDLDGVRLFATKIFSRVHSELLNLVGLVDFSGLGVLLNLLCRSEKRPIKRNTAFFALPTRRVPSISAHDDFDITDQYPAPQRSR